MTDLKISEQLMDLIFEAVKEATLIVKLGQPLTPFTLTITKGGVVMSRFTDESLTDAIARARTMLANTDTDTHAYALIYDAEMTLAGHSTDVIMVEAGERAQEQGWRFVQRYQPRTQLHKFETIGNIAFIERMEHYLS